MTHLLVFHIFGFFKSLGLLGAFLSMFIENVGVPLPTEIGYLIGQNMIVQGVHSYFFILFVLTAGHLAGALVSYGVGRWGGEMVMTKLKGNKKINEVHVKLEKWYKKYGSLTVFLTRFVGYVRPWSSLVAGFAEVPFWPFLLWTTLGTIIFNIMTLYFSGVILLVWRRFAFFHFWIILIVAVSFLAVFIYGIVVSLLPDKKEKERRK